MSEKTHVRCYVPPETWTAEPLEISGEEWHHLVRVLRVRCGDVVEIFNGRGGIGTAKVELVEHRLVRLRPLTHAQQPPPRPAVTLIQAILRETPMDWVLQKAVELGVSILAPVWTARGVVRPAPSENRKRRWEAIVLNAVRQSRTAWWPVVETPRALTDFLARVPRPDLFLVAALDPDAIPLRVALEVGGRTPESVAVLVGPEGDFTPEELRAAKEAGAVAVSLGERTLRAETAALYLLSVIQYQYGALD